MNVNHYNAKLARSLTRICWWFWSIT